MKPIFQPVRIVAVQLGVPRGWLAREAREGRVPSIRAGRRVLLDPVLVEAVLRQRCTTDSGDQAKAVING